MVTNTTFAGACQTGQADPTQIDAWVERWHSEPMDLELHEFLGLTLEEYARWVKEPYSIHEIILAKRP
jgi:hypothetical protein